MIFFGLNIKIMLCFRNFFLDLNRFLNVIISDEYFHALKFFVVVYFIFIITLCLFLHFTIFIVERLLQRFLRI